MANRKHRRPRLIDIVHASLQRRREAIERWKKNPFSAPELVVVRCRICGRPIATTTVAQKQGEPPILLELRDEHEPERVQCTECGVCLCCGCFLGLKEGDGIGYCVRCLGHVEGGAATCDASHMSPFSRRRQAAARGAEGGEA